MKKFTSQEFITGVFINFFSSALLIIIGKSLGIDDEKSIVLIITAIILGVAIAYFSILFLKKRIDKIVSNEIEKRIGINFKDFDNSSKRFSNLFESYKDLTKTLLNIVEPKFKEDHFLLAIINGVSNKISKDIQLGNKGVYFLDSDFYTEILNLISDNDIIYAIADRQNNLEINLWDSLSPEQKTKVTERIFFIPWQTFFDNQKLEKEFNIYSEQIQHYPLRFNHKPLIPYHNEFKDRNGFDFFIVSPDILGYYVYPKNRKENQLKNYLKIINNQSEYKKALTEYNHWSKNSIVFDNKYTCGDDLRTAWLNHNDFGKWTWKNTKVEKRPQSYFTFYDIHIRCWIWLYNELTEQVIDTSKQFIKDQINHTPQIRILEIGFGTGSVTLPLLSWINDLNRRLRYSEDMTIRFTGIDRAAKQMKDELKKKGWNDQSYFPHELLEGSAWRAVKNHSDTKYNLIIASLVVHDITESNPTKEFATFLIDSKKHLSPEGVIVIADIFPKKGSDEIAKWLNYMSEIGISKPDIDEFKKYNPEMIDPIKLEDAIKIATNIGFIVDIHHLISEQSEECPFRVLSFKLSNSSA